MYENITDNELINLFNPPISDLPPYLLECAIYDLIYIMAEDSGRDYKDEEFMEYILQSTCLTEDAYRTLMYMQ